MYNYYNTMDFSDIFTREIDERFCYIQYDKFDLIMIKENNYINATKLCQLGNKKLRNWLKLDTSKELIMQLESVNRVLKINITESYMNDENYYPLKAIINVCNEDTTDNTYEVSGAYVHPDLIPHIAFWISPLFAVKVSRIINCYMLKQYEFQLKEKKDINEELLHVLHTINRKYDKDTIELKERYYEQRKELREYNKQNNEKYDKDTKRLKEYNKRMEEKYNRDITELKEYSKRMEERYNKDIKELKEYNKRMEEKYNKDIKELKERNKELSKYSKHIEDKYDINIRELKVKLDGIRDSLKTSISNISCKLPPPNSNEPPQLVIKTEILK
ncbi:CNPV217 N1R/p28-like protein [Canarypox virus]|uniref:CNPV217 N1R/p28-like protein n=1 Tax=Canarypox virus TaxID=44088 RepID=Q6VZD0_CNPV|nr:CNPV217 N1R/p28-like protein [Canarypox virus]AAR83563.1 CNPV217 N1R/p28-like protein [Canarypox virus]AWD84693.1 N1R/p28-like protein [Canarypox virus]